MSLIDPHRSWLTLEARAAAEENERRRALLKQVRDHMEFEIRGQLEPLMGTLIDEPVYHFWNENPFVLEGHDQILSFYTDLIKGGRNQFEVVVERIVVDDNAVVTEGQVKQVYLGEMVKAMGVAEIDDRPVAAGDLILTTTQLITLWPAAEDGRLIGEDIYFGHNPLMNAERIAAEDLPDYYQHP